MIQQYFGSDMRNRFDNVVGRELVEAGSLVEGMWKAREVADQTRPSLDLNERISSLASMIYECNLQMLQALQSGAIGIYLPEHPDDLGARAQFP